jgi:hypothetical protein
MTPWRGLDLTWWWVDDGVIGTAAGLWLGANRKDGKTIFFEPG